MPNHNLRLVKLTIGASEELPCFTVQEYFLDIGPYRIKLMDQSEQAINRQCCRPTIDRILNNNKIAVRWRLQLAHLYKCFLDTDHLQVRGVNNGNKDNNG